MVVLIWFIHHSTLHSFPTRRSSDLVPFGAVVLVMLWVGACASSSSPPVALTIPEPPPRVAIAPVALVEVLPTENFAPRAPDRKSTRLNSSHVSISYAVFCLTKKMYP